ncbi:MAG: hypothetical protein WCP34_10545, partial [Pseudomonadota bacterium]
MNINLTAGRRTPLYLSLLGVTLVFLFTLLGYFLRASYHQAIQAAEVTTRNLVQALEARLQGNLARVDAALGLLAHEATPAMMQKSAVAARHQNLTAHMAPIMSNFPDVTGVYYFDTEGDLIYSSDPEARATHVSDRPFFRHFRDNPGDTGLAFSDALVARTTGRWS